MAKQLQRIDCTVEFVTPAFLGNAFQKGQWRVPPFKALLRRWWRILRAGELNYDWERLRREEGLLWGNAFLEEPKLAGQKNGHRRSLIDVRLASWDMGTLRGDQWNRMNFGKEKHSQNSRYALDVDVYLGYGAVLPPSKRQGRKHKELAHPPAIADGQKMAMTLIVRDEGHASTVRQVLGLLHTFGTIGSRANNGWGSLALSAETEELLLSIPASRDWQACLQRDWPHAFGKDEKGVLVWLSKPFGEWTRALKEIARIKAMIRDIAKDIEPYKNNKQKTTAVFLLGYPVQGPHDIAPEQPQLRWASPLRFKVIRDDRGYRALAYHLPHKPPPPIWQIFSGTSAIQRWIEEVQVELWLNIHEAMDEEWQRWKEARP